VVELEFSISRPAVKEQTGGLAVEANLPSGKNDWRQLCIANCSNYVPSLWTIQRHRNDSLSAWSWWYRTVQTPGLRGRSNVPVNI